MGRASAALPKSMSSLSASLSLRRATYVRRTIRLTIPDDTSSSISLVLAFNSTILGNLIVQLIIPRNRDDA
jgi:hypothetical protein